MEQTKVVLTRAGLISLSLSLMILASSCVSVRRFNESGNLRTADGDRRDFERQTARDELGAGSSDRAITARQYLKRAEKNLDGKSEREQYYKAKPHLKNDLERLQFLELDSTAARDRYLNAKGINGDQISHPFEMQSLVDQNDIAAGMTRQAVKESWGPPDDVEIAGNPLYGNEKWKYSEQVTSSEGYMTEKRTVTFEGGRVVGWETR